MMLEISPEMTFGVLSPAFRGCEGNYALDFFKNTGCTFFINKLCELHGTGHQPLECRFCHHARKGLGTKCHADIEKEWNTQEGQRVVRKWIAITEPGKKQKNN